MTMRENLVLDLREAADKWRANHPAVMTFEIRYDLALCEAADAIEELSKQNEKWEEVVKTALDFIPCWIPVTERLPSENNRYLTVSIEPWFGTTIVDTMRWSGVWMLDGRQTEATVTHWMPLPEPPKEERKDDGNS